jgi:hypothetical protein
MKKKTEGTEKKEKIRNIKSIKKEINNERKA